MTRAWLNGRIVETASAGAPLDDIGLLRGYAVFEVIRTFGKRPFRLEDHLARLEASAEFMGLAVPEPRERIREAIDELIERNGIDREAQVRIVLTGGRSPDGLLFDPARPTFYVLVGEFVGFPAEDYERGVRLVTTEHRRTFPRVKSIDYAKAIRLLPEVRARGALEVLYVWGGKVLEGASSNLFLVKDGTVITPREDVLPGVTRAHVLELLEADGVPVEERAVAVEELAGADEAFLTSTTKDVMPVVRIDETTIGGGTPGTSTRRLMELFAESVTRWAGRAGAPGEAGRNRKRASGFSRPTPSGPRRDAEAKP